MRILIITDLNQEEDRIRNELTELCEPDSIQFEYSFHSATDFINNYIVKHQVPLDLIICKSRVGFERSNGFRDRIRSDFKSTYSKRDFNLSEIPISLLVSSNENKNAFNGYDLKIDNLGVDKLHLFVSDFILTIKEWRKSVLKELDSLGIKLNSGIIDYSEYFSLYNKKIVSTRILSDNFKLFPRKLNYYWLDFDAKQIEKSIDEFVKLLKRSRRLGKKGEEKVYHKFFNDNKFFLLRDNYTKYWYEPRLKKNEINYDEPDFILQPNFIYKTDLSLLEVKLPNEVFLKKKKTHISPRSKFIDHLIQVNDYKDYLESEEYKIEINKLFGRIPENISYNLLIGRIEEKNERMHELNKTMRQLGQGHINLMTYDELMEYQVKFLSKMNLLNIKN